MGEGSNLKSWLSNHHITEREFCDRLTTSSENNFMYLTQIMGAITDNLYSEPFEYNQLPPALAAYYQQHLQMMLPPAQQQELSHAILNILATQQQPISAEAIAQALTCQFADILDIDEFTVEEILENWLEFLQRRRTGYQTQYQIYHSSFRDWIIQIWS
ncbi:hypothetical protein PN456_04405 [Nodularia spumigena CS-586/05]|uniref:hypothetical protein n=2 Tax=Cyanobacteriota TaxID=1117 RepID=UPI00232AB927|nr:MULTISPECIES: hypothetical protein [Cyanophyceae]MDB9357828.1 hypothetical protein [Nodularia spumigena CS-587/03]MDB9497358.1 hypothetical protein [Nodularia spumigena CS-336/02]MDB9321499.1 hypothetical protein [Nodularia spumigena CS-591/07A]MDB9328980.1 hypothetical protein [Nodularia spumigena CS-591/04]MDB9341007.1 hypothetical protein [Nodularia spumigena CS-589/07]